MATLTTCADGTVITTSSSDRIHRSDHQYTLHDEHSFHMSLFTSSKQCTMTASQALVMHEVCVFLSDRSDASRLLRKWRKLAQKHPNRYTLECNSDTSSSAGEADNPYCSEYCPPLTRS